MRPSKSMWLIAGIVVALLAVTAIVMFLRFQQFASMSFERPPAGVVVQDVVLRNFDDRIEAIGTAMANEGATLSATVSETVKAIHFSEGDRVAAGTVLVELMDDEERAELSEADKSLERVESLTRQKAVSEAQRDSEKARRDIAGAQLKDRTITAPFDGVVGLRHVSVGDLVTPGFVITTIDDVDPIKLEFSIPEIYLNNLTKDMTIEALASAFPGEVFNGSILAIDSRVDPVTRAVRVKAEIANADLRLRPGMLMTVQLVRNQRQALAVAEESLLSQGEQKSVLVVGADNKVEARPVTIGVRRAGYVEILDGLSEGDRVIVEGIMKAFPGAEVNVTGTRTIDDQIQGAAEFAVPGKQKHFPAVDDKDTAVDEDATDTTSETPAGTP